MSKRTPTDHTPPLVASLIAGKLVSQDSQIILPSEEAGWLKQKLATLVGEELRLELAGIVKLAWRLDQHQPGSAAGRTLLEVAAERISLLSKQEQAALALDDLFDP